jgi:hypothetical protein
MQEKIEKLESRQREILEQIPREDFILWKSSPVTKFLLLQLEIDLEQIKDNWINDYYAHSNTLEASERGKANYNLAVTDVIAALGSKDD